MFMGATAKSPCNPPARTMRKTRRFLRCSQRPPLHQGSRTSLLPAAIHSATTEVTRTSYQTDGTGTSRISGLSDFPAPPNQTIVSSDRVELLKSYFGGEVHSRPVSQTMSSPRSAPAPASSVSSSSSSRLQRPAFGESSRLSYERPRGEDTH